MSVSPVPPTRPHVPGYGCGREEQRAATDARARRRNTQSEAPADVPKARKDTVLVPPKQTVQVEFDTNNPGRWISHCRDTYHLEEAWRSSSSTRAEGYFSSARDMTTRVGIWLVPS